MRHQISVLIVEDHEMLTQTLAIALAGDGFDVRTPEDLTVESVVEHARSVDVVLLDLDLGAKASGLGMIGPLRDAGAEVVVVTGNEDRVRHGECIEAGASGVFQKSQPFERLIDAIVTASGHGAVTADDARQQLLRELRGDRMANQVLQEPFDRLTPRERQVLQFLVEGVSPGKIAAELVVTLATVRTQIRSVLTKLGVNSQLEAVALARRAGWSHD